MKNDANKKSKNMTDKEFLEYLKNNNQLKNIPSGLYGSEKPESLIELFFGKGL